MLAHITKAERVLLWLHILLLILLLVIVFFRKQLGISQSAGIGLLYATTAVGVLSHIALPIARWTMAPRRVPKKQVALKVLAGFVLLVAPFALFRDLLQLPPSLAFLVHWVTIISGLVLVVMVLAHKVPEVKS